MSTTANTGFVLAEQIAGVETLIAGSRASMLRGGASADDVQKALAPALRAVQTLRWLQNNRDAVVAASGAS